jgi:hypothetical protein
VLFFATGKRYLSGQLTIRLSRPGLLREDSSIIDLPAAQLEDVRQPITKYVIASKIYESLGLSNALHD